MKRWSFALIVLALAACAHREQASQGASSAAPSVALVTAKDAHLADTVAATGRFGAAAGSQAHLAFSEPGVIGSIGVGMGDRVGEGETVAQLDTTKLSLAANQASADVRAADAARQQAQVDRTTAKTQVDAAAVARARTLYAAGVAPRKDIDEAQARLADDRAEAASAHAGIASSQAQVDSAQTRVALAQRDIAQAALRSPLSGVVAAVLHRPGEWVDAGTPVLLVAPVQSNELTLTVAAQDVVRVHPGALVHFDVAGSGAHGTGTVTGVAPMVDPQSQSGNVTVRAATSAITPGSTVQATIDVAGLDGIVLPEASVVQDPQTQKTLVFIAQRQRTGPSRFEQRVVSVVGRSKGQVLVHGVRPGERVASEGAFALLAPADAGGD